MNLLIIGILDYVMLASHYAGTKAIVAGWGSIKENGKSTCILRDVKIPIISNLDCIQNTNYASGMITENMICAGYLDGEEDSCQVCYIFHNINNVCMFLKTTQGTSSTEYSIDSSQIFFNVYFFLIRVIQVVH